MIRLLLLACVVQCIQVKGKGHFENYGFDPVHENEITHSLTNRQHELHSTKTAMVERNGAVNTSLTLHSFQNSTILGNGRAGNRNAFGNITMQQDRCTATTFKPTASELFVPISGQPPPFEAMVEEHTILPIGLQDTDTATQTNKFYTNLLTGDQKQPVYTHPYTVTWTGCRRNLCHSGIGVSHIDEKDFYLAGGSPAPYFYAPTDQHSIVFSSSDISQRTTLATSGGTSMGITLELRSETNNKILEMPIVQGMGFVTATYFDTPPIIGSLIGIRNFVSFEQPNLKDDQARYHITLNDGSEWVLYAFPSTGFKVPRFVMKENGSYGTDSHFQGVIQVAKVPLDSVSEALEIYNKCAGKFAVYATLSGISLGNVAQYAINWQSEGPGSHLLMFLLPHHIQSIAPEHKSQLQNLKLRTTTKGVATAIIGSKATFVESALPNNVGFYPWSPDLNRQKTCLKDLKRKTFIKDIAQGEIDTDIVRKVKGQESVYWAGKLVASYARLVHLSTILEDSALTNRGLSKLKLILNDWIENRQRCPLSYDKTWGGIITSCSYEKKGPREDYGNGLYNDHHFHYGYWVYAASVIGSLDPSWASEPKTRDWVNALVQDYANPLNDDYFPFSRAFDWFHGHSWASGIESLTDGKNEESTSEDAYSLYAMKLWASVIGDVSMEARGNLQLAILRRSIRNYFLMENDNPNHPQQFRGHKAVGIVSSNSQRADVKLMNQLFENKIDHTTWFGNKLEYIHGIQLLPISPITPYIRSKKFALEEWNQYFEGYEFKDQAWMSVLKGGQTVFNPEESYRFFSSSDFRSSFLMDGDSRAYYLMYSAVLAEM